MPKRAVGVNVNQAGCDDAPANINCFDVRAERAHIGDADDSFALDNNRFTKCDFVQQNNAPIAERKAVGGLGGRGGECHDRAAPNASFARLAAEAVAFLGRIADEYPEDAIALPPAVAERREPTVPLFRARMIGLGFDPERELVLIELRERADDEEDDAAPAVSDVFRVDDDDEGYVARIYATRPQVRAMAAHGAGVVTAGRPRWAASAACAWS